MDELDSSSTTRLRRRSFFENIEPDPSAFAAPTQTTSLGSGVSIPDKDSASLSAAPNANNNSSANSNSAGHTATTPSSSSSSSAAASPSMSPLSSSMSTQPSSTSAASSMASSRGHNYRGGVVGALAHWLLGCLLTLLHPLQRWLQLRWQRLQLHDKPLFRYLASLRSTQYASGTHWAYPTQWLTFGCATLVVAQVVVATHFAHAPLSLHVKECVFHEQLMPSLLASTATTTAAGGGGVSVRMGRWSASAAPVLRSLERRFEQLHSHVGVAHQHAPRLPWTCVAIVASSADDAAQANALALLLPRSRVLTPSTVASVASRFQLAVGATPFAAAANLHAGVRGATFSLRDYRDALVASRSSDFPDLVLVETAFALQQLVRVRQEQQDALSVDHGARASAPFGIFYTQATVPDVLDRHIRKHWDAFLHVVVVNGTDEQIENAQFTQQLLTLWRAHPEWPMLFVRFTHSLSLCRAFERFVRPQAHPEATNNIDLVCDDASNARNAIVVLKNRIGMHLFMAPVRPEASERNVVLESLAVGAIVVTYESPVMHEWICDACGVRVGTLEVPSPHDTDGNNDGALALPAVHVTSQEIERAIASLLALGRVHRVARGRAARVHYLRMRTHYLSAIAALDTAICDDDTDDAIDVESEIGRRSRKTVNVETLRVFLH